MISQEPDKTRAFVSPQEIEVAIEVVSPSSADEDRILKPALYARHGISEYWRVERSTDDENDAVIFQHMLAHTKDGVAAYVETGVTTLSALEKAAS